MQVHTVLITLQKAGVVDNAVYRGDLVFQDDQPVLVLEWSGERGSSDPVVTVKLSRDCLAEAAGHQSADYIHSEPRDDPRP